MLKPCPFCGSDRLRYFSLGVFASVLICQDCGTRGPKVDHGDIDNPSMKETIARVAWNERAEVATS